MGNSGFAAAGRITLSSHMTANARHLAWVVIALRELMASGQEALQTSENSHEWAPLTGLREAGVRTTSGY
jgi:hypothetical protein